MVNVIVDPRDRRPGGESFRDDQSCSRHGFWRKLPVYDSSSQERPSCCPSPLRCCASNYVAVQCAGSAGNWTIEIAEMPRAEGRSWGRKRCSISRIVKYLSQNRWDRRNPHWIFTLQSGFEAGWFRMPDQSAVIFANCACGTNSTTYIKPLQPHSLDGLGQPSFEEHFGGLALKVETPQRPRNPNE